MHGLIPVKTLIGPKNDKSVPSFMHWAVDMGRKLRDRFYFSHRAPIPSRVPLQSIAGNALYKKIVFTAFYNAIVNEKVV